MYRLMDMGVSDNTRGLLLAMVSSLFIGTSFIFKKKGLLRAAAAGTRAGIHGFILICRVNRILVFTFVN